MARSGSFSAAARELGCTQPAISQQMKALEKSVETPLVVRAGRSMQLTEAGRALLKHANGILAGLVAAEEEVAAIAGLRAGRVRLVSFPTASSTLVPRAVAGVRATHPGVQVSLVEAEPPEALAMLRGGECEVALAFRYRNHPQCSGLLQTGGEADPPASAGGEPVIQPEPPVQPAGGYGSRRAARAEAVLEAAASVAASDWSDLVVRPLLDDRLVGLVPAGHPLAKCAGLRPVRLAELAHEQWIAGCPQCRGHLVDLCARAGFDPRIDFATDDYPAVMGLVSAGLGVAVLPGLALEPVRDTGVAAVELIPEATRQVVALTLPDLVEVPAVALMLDRLARVAAEHPAHSADPPAAAAV